MVQKLEDLEMVEPVSAVVGEYAGGGNFTFECEDGKYGKEGDHYYLAVKYDEVKRSANPPKMMTSKWNGRTEWNLSWIGLKDNPPTKGELHNLGGDGRWAFFRITQGG